MTTPKRDLLGSIIGLVTFGCGIALLAWTFSVATNLFGQSPENLLKIKAGVPLDINEAGKLVIALVYRVAMLIFMCIVGSIIANRGIKLYMAGRVPHNDQTPKRPAKAVVQESEIHS